MPYHSIRRFADFANQLPRRQTLANNLPVGAGRRATGNYFHVWARIA